MVKRWSFSILKRIEPPATFGVEDRFGFVGIFQYPQTDRTPCNHATAIEFTIKVNLSVSSNGSNPLQHFMAYLR